MYSELVVCLNVFTLNSNMMSYQHSFLYCRSSLPAYCSAEAIAALPNDCDVFQDLNGSLGPVISGTPLVADDIHSACEVAVCTYHDTDTTGKSESICELHHRLLYANAESIVAYPCSECGTYHQTARYAWIPI